MKALRDSGQGNVRSKDSNKAQEREAELKVVQCDQLRGEEFELFSSW